MKKSFRSRQVPEAGKFVLAYAAERGSNSYGIIRVIAAFLVIWTHAFSVIYGANASEPLKDLTGFSAGSHAVNIFFSLSGFMVAASWERSRNLFDFVIARVLRIMPALIFVNLLVVILSAVFLTSASQSSFWTFGNVGTFLARSTLIFSSGTTLEGVFADNPWPGVINIPIWTIRFEVVCYASLAAAMLLLAFLYPSPAQRRLAFLVVLALAASVIMWRELAEQFEVVGNLARFTFAFYLGVLAWFERDRVVLSLPRLAAIGLLLAIAIGVDSTVRYPLAIAATAYLTFWAGSFQAGSVQLAADRTDLSFGMYISGFFIQQWLVQAFPGQGILANTIAATLLAASFAWLSWNVIEKPALQLRAKFWRWRVPVNPEPHPEPQR